MKKYIIQKRNASRYYRSWRANADENVWVTMSAADLFTNRNIAEIVAKREGGVVVEIEVQTP